MMKKHTNIWIVLSVMLLSAAPRASAESVNSSFTYQGQLKSDGVPFDGLADFDFSLWDAEVDGAQIDTTLQLLDVEVSDGVFVVELDFGASAFAGDARWLEITVEGSVLSPRQPVLATPYATHADQTRGIVVDESGNVGIGVDVPTAALDVDGEAKATLFTGDGSGLTNLPVADPLWQENGADIHYDAGNVGIGTTEPQAALHVAGDVVSDTGWFGTKDATPIELYVNDTRAMRFEYAEVDATPAPNFIGGHLSNTVTSGGGAVIAGGGGDGAINQVSGDWGTVSGGKGNWAFGDRSVVAGGEGNTAAGSWSAASGGQSNTASGDMSSVSGGLNNESNGVRSHIGGGSGNVASGLHAVVGGGEGNAASGDHSMVSGGFSNEATGNYSYASGRRAKANHDGAFVWADSTAEDFASTSADQFLIRADGGVGIGTNAPLAALDVVGDIAVSGAIQSANQNMKIRRGVAIPGNFFLEPGVGSGTDNNFFGYTFNSPPLVILTVAQKVGTQDINALRMTASAWGVRNDGFGWMLFNQSDFPQNAGTIQINWIAIGE